jgi:sulfur-oxidizing protein SoxY
MDQARRDVLKMSAVLGLSVLGGVFGSLNAVAAEWSAKNFEAKGLDNALKELGIDHYTMSNDVSVISAEIAENGAVVPVSVASAIPNTDYIAILVEKNPNPLSIAFTVPAGTEAAFTTRVKMGETSKVYALAKADGKWFASSKEVKVTLGGCGG